MLAAFAFEPPDWPPDCVDQTAKEDGKDDSSQVHLSS